MMLSTSHVLHLDIETRSVLDIRETGVYPYALHPLTDIWVACYAFDDEPLSPPWYPGMPCPDRIADHVRSGGIVTGWNAGLFERIIWKCILSRRYGWPEPKLEQWEDTMVWALTMSFPGELDKAAQAIGSQVRKDLAGRRLMLQMAKPRKIKEDGTVIWWDQPERIERLTAYCGQDVETERSIAKLLLPLSNEEREMWLIDLRINDRGFKIDLPFVAAAKRIVERRIEKLNARLSQVTGGRVRAVSNVGELGNWMRQLGYPTESLDKDAVSKLRLSFPAPDPAMPVESLTDKERIGEALRIRQIAGKSSIAKLNKFETFACADSRARGVYQFNQAGPGRWSSKGIQAHNMPRGKKEHQARFDELCEAISTGDDDWVDLEFGDPMDAVSSAIRGCIVAPHGKLLVVRDYSAIESRVLAWSAGEEWKLQAYRAFDLGIGPDIYKLIYARHFNVDVDDVDKEQRQLGKVKDLSLGYQGGVGAFADMAATYGISIPDMALAARPAIPIETLEQATENFNRWGTCERMPFDERISREEQWIVCEALKLMFRRSHPATEAYWYALEAAACSAVRYPGKTFRIQHPQYRFQDFRYRVANKHLWCRLPSGRLICYPFPRLEKTNGIYGKRDVLVYMGVDATTKQWVPQYSYGGHLAENNTQGISACFLRLGIRRATEHGIPIVMHTHDELISEEEASKAEATLDMMGRLMAQPAPWAPDCPITSAGFVTHRYRKD